MADRHVDKHHESITIGHAAKNVCKGPVYMQHYQVPPYIYVYLKRISRRFLDEYNAISDTTPSHAGSRKRHDDAHANAYDDVARFYARLRQHHALTTAYDDVGR